MALGFRGGRPPGLSDDYGSQAPEGVEVPTNTQDTQATPWIWKVLIPLLWFRDLRAGLFVLGSILGIGIIVRYVGWQPLIIAPVAGGFAWWWWSRHHGVEEVMVIEVRAQGQNFRAPNVPYDLVVTDSSFRVFFGPKKLYDRAVKWGTYSTIYEVPANVIICDYFDELRNVFIFNEDPDWTNAAIVFQMNSEMAKSIKRYGFAQKWFKNKQREAYLEHKLGKLSKDELVAVLRGAEQQMDIIRESPMTKRSFAHYYQETIPRLKREVIELLKGIEEYSFALAAEMAYALYGAPMTPEAEHSIKTTKDKFGKLRLNIFSEFELMPEFQDNLGEPEAFQQVHELAQQAAGATGRVANVPPMQRRQRVV